MTFAPTFSVFKYCVKYQGAEYVPVPLNDDFTIDMYGMREAFTPNARLLYLCSPNNPTASQLKRKEIEALTEEFPGIVLVDEAYGEYADYSAVPLINKYEKIRENESTYEKINANMNMYIKDLQMLLEQLEERLIG